MKINDLDYLESLHETRVKWVQGGFGVKVSAYAQASGDSGTYGNAVTLTKVLKGSLLDGRGHATAIAYDSTGNASTFTAVGANLYGKTNFLFVSGVNTAVNRGKMSASNQDVTIVGAKYSR